MATVRTVRPRTLYDEPASQAIRVRVTSAQKKAIERMAEDNHTNVSDAIRTAINTYVEDYAEARVFPAVRRSSAKPIGGITP